MATAAADARRRRPRPEPTPAAARSCASLAKTPVQILLLARRRCSGSCRRSGSSSRRCSRRSDFNANGWWQVLSHPTSRRGRTTTRLSNNTDIPHSLVTTARDRDRRHRRCRSSIAALAGYAFAWLDFPGRDWLFVARDRAARRAAADGADPDLHALQHLGLFDTVFGLILFHTAFGLPFAIFLLRNFFIGIPKDILESARIDGASEIRIFLRLILPLGLPAIASLAIFQFLWTWNDLLVALVVRRGTRSRSRSRSSPSSGSSARTSTSSRRRRSSRSSIPLAVFFAFQRYFVQGLLAGSVK